MLLSTLLITLFFSFILINCFVSNPFGIILFIYNLISYNKNIYTISVIYLTYNYNSICYIPAYFCFFDKVLYRLLFLITIYRHI
jgi:hypothetical protein